MRKGNKMKKLFTVLSVLLLIIGISSSAYAIQYGISSAKINFDSLEISYNYANGIRNGQNNDVDIDYIGLYTKSVGFAYAADEYGSDRQPRRRAACCVRSG